MNREQANKIAREFSIPLDDQFHALDSDIVQRIIDAADMWKYRAPKNANGSRARYFHAALVRAVNVKTTLEIQVQGCYSGKWECLCAASTWKEAREDLKSYRGNEPGPFRIRRVRVAI